MGFLSRYSGTTKLVLDTDEDGSEWWVELKNCLSVRESDAASRAMLSMTMEGESNGSAATQSATKLRAKPDIESNIQELVFSSIVDWNLTDEHDQVLPLVPDGAKRQSIARLPRKVFEEIGKVVRASNSDASTEDTKSLLTGGGGGDAVGEDGASDNREVLD